MWVACRRLPTGMGRLVADGCNAGRADDTIPIGGESDMVVGQAPHEDATQPV